MAHETVAALVAACQTQKPLEVRDAFGAAIAQKVADRVDDVRADVEDAFFGQRVVDDEDEEIQESVIRRVGSHVNPNIDASESRRNHELYKKHSEAAKATTDKDQKAYHTRLANHHKKIVERKTGLPIDEEEERLEESNDAGTQFTKHCDPEGLGRYCQYKTGNKIHTVNYAPENKRFIIQDGGENAEGGDLFMTKHAKHLLPVLAKLGHKVSPDHANRIHQYTKRSVDEEVEGLEEGQGVIPNAFYIVGHVKPEHRAHYGGEKVIVGGPYDHRHEGLKDAQAFHGHPHYDSVTVKDSHHAKHLPFWS